MDEPRLHWWERTRSLGDVIDEFQARRNLERQRSEGPRENVLHGVLRRHSPPPGLDPPIRPPRPINVTFCVNDTALAYSRGRAVVEGTSVNALVCRFLEEYSGVSRPPGSELSRRIPMFRRRPTKPSESDDAP
jgi:hypothetical protein